MKIEYLIFIYGLICCAMIVFNCACIVLFKRQNHLLRRRSQALTTSIQQQMERLKKNEKIEERHKRFIRKKCSKIQHLMVFDETLSAFVSEDEILTQYHEQMQAVYVSLACEYVNKEAMQVAYFAYVMAKYHIGAHQEMNPMTSILLTVLKRDSLYCKQNAMRVFYAMGNVEDILEALEVINQQDTFYHAKILTDGLLTFAGNHEQLIQAIWLHRKEWKWQVQLACLNYIRFQSGAYQQEFFDLLKDESQHRELHFAAIRYLGRYPYAPAKQQLLAYVNDADGTKWEYAAFSATTLSNYSKEDTIPVLKKACSSSNWYVRNNAAMSLGKLGLQYRDLLDVIQGDDRYAREIVLYHFNERRLKEETYA